MFTIYVYVLDTLADWELGHVISDVYKRQTLCLHWQPPDLKWISLR